MCPSSSMGDYLAASEAACHIQGIHLAGRARRTPASVRRPARRSGSKSMISPNRWACIANMAPKRNVNQGTCDTWFSQLASTEDEQAEPELGLIEDLSPTHGHERRSGDGHLRLHHS